MRTGWRTRSLEHVPMKSSQRRVDHQGRCHSGARAKRRVIEFFKNEYISVQNVTREVAEVARDLVWDKKIKPKDAVHVASAIAAGCQILDDPEQSRAFIEKAREIGADKAMRRQMRS